MDEMVLQVQQWVNATYGDKPGYNKIEENGKTGWSTVYALTRALQLELGITATADNFGDGTASEYRKWGEMELGKVPTDEKGQKIVQIFQGACWCKGYNPGGFNGTFGTSCQSAAIQLQTDAGLPIRDGKVYDYVFKAFLTMDAYVLTYGGDSRIRELQQNLNYNYYTTSGVQPCDGHYQRSTQKAIVYGLQTEIGIAPGSQTGSVGPATQNGLPTLSVGSSGNFVKLFQYLLYVNNFDPGSFDGQYGSGVKSVVMTFQEFTLLAADGIAGKQTWLSLLLSTGDPNRKGTACDCITTITPARGAALKAAGYETVGRYLANARVIGSLDKMIKPGELNTIFNAGLTVFPIYQTQGDSASYFNYSQGFSDVSDAYGWAIYHGFKAGTTIYFAVDYDALGAEITNNILSYFSAIKTQMEKFDIKYKVGVYGTRNLCIQVSAAGYAESSFVSGMSTGYSGNLGYPLPSNWAFDQISTIKVGFGDGNIEIDNNIKSGRYNGESSVDLTNVISSAIYSKWLELIDAIPLLNLLPVSDFTLEKEMTIFDLGLVKLTVVGGGTINNESDGMQIFSVTNGEIDVAFLTELSPYFENLTAEYRIDATDFAKQLGAIIENGNIETSTYIADGYLNIALTINSEDISTSFDDVTANASFQFILSFRTDWTELIPVFDFEAFFESIDSKTAATVGLVIVVGAFLFFGKEIALSVFTAFLLAYVASIKDVLGIS